MTGGREWVHVFPVQPNGVQPRGNSTQHVMNLKLKEQNKWDEGTIQSTAIDVHSAPSSNLIQPRQGGRIANQKYKKAENCAV